MKKSVALYLSAREASAELAISPATLYAYVSRGLIRSEPSSDSRSHRYRAEDVRGLKERRAPSPEPRGLQKFRRRFAGDGFGDRDHHRGRPDLPRRQLHRSRRNRHARTCRDVAVGRGRRRSVRGRQLSACIRRDAQRCRGRARCRADRPHDRRAGAGRERRSARLHPRRRRTRDGWRPHPAAGGRDDVEPRIIGGTASSPDRQGLGAGQQACRRSDPPRTGAARRT